MLFVYWLERHPAYYRRIDQIHAGMLRRGDQLCTSIFTLGEVLAGPVRDSDSKAANDFRAFFRAPEIRLLPFDVETAEQYAQIRGRYRVAPPDAIHLAAAAAAGATLFLTNDRRLHRRQIAGIGIIAGLDINVY